MSEFHKTVNLKDKIMTEEKARREALIKRELKPKKKIVKKQKPTRAAAIDMVFNDEPIEEDKKKNFSQINRPKTKNLNINYVNLFVVAILVLAVGFFAYDKFFRESSTNDEEAIKIEAKWYMVKLSNEETFYGLISDVKADPIEIKNVYYNYDQINSNGKIETEPPKNLRLVKRGKEKHGPDGSLNIIRSQVVYLESLSSSSKVLEKILENEKKYQ